MSWLFGGGKKSGPVVTNLQTQKTKQIESLRKINVNVTEIIRDVEYRVTFFAGTTNYTLVIILPPQFPQEKPVVSVLPSVHHRWVDSDMKLTSCPALHSFSMHSDLGQAVQTIVDDFKRTTPGAMQYNHMPTTGPYPPTSHGHQSSPYPPMIHSSVGGFPPPSHVQSPSLPPQAYPPTTDMPQQVNPLLSGSYNIPHMPHIKSILNDKSISELNELMYDENHLLETIQQLPEVEQIVTDRADLFDKCAQLAKENLSRKPNLIELQNELRERANALESGKQGFERDCERHLSLLDQFSPSNIQTNLKVAVMEAEEETERIAEDFMNKKINIEEFTQTFMDKRTLFHKRRAKEEKLNQIILTTGHAY